MLQVTCAIIIRKNRILITQNGGISDHPFQWEFPGGKINLNESSEDCIKREIREELNIDIHILKNMVSVEFNYGFKQIELNPFLCSIKKGEIKLHEHNDFKWIELEELKEFDLSEADEKLIGLKENRNILKEYIGK